MLRLIFIRTWTGILKTSLIFFLDAWNELVFYCFDATSSGIPSLDNLLLNGSLDDERRYYIMSVHSQPAITCLCLTLLTGGRRKGMAIAPHLVSAMFILLSSNTSPPLPLLLSFPKVENHFEEIFRFVHLTFFSCFGAFFGRKKKGKEDFSRVDKRQMTNKRKTID